MVDSLLSCSRTDKTKAVVEEKCKALSNSVSKLETLSSQNLTSISTHLCNIGAAANGLMKVQDAASFIARSISEVVDQEPVLIAEIDRLQECHKADCSTFSKNFKSVVICCSLLIHDNFLTFLLAILINLYLKCFEPASLDGSC